MNYSNFKVKGTEFRLQLPGLFNVENALGAISVAISEKIDLATARTALEKIAGIPGRMEYVPNDKNIDINILPGISGNLIDVGAFCWLHWKTFYRILKNIFEIFESKSVGFYGNSKS